MTDSQEVEVQKHIRCVPGDVARSVLLPGDPARARRIGEQLEEARLIAENREYVVFTGKTNGVAVSVCSTRDRRFIGSHRPGRITQCRRGGVYSCRFCWWTA